MYCILDICLICILDLRALQDFFEDLRPSELQPLGVLQGKGSEEKLKRLHAAVMEATKGLFEKKSVAQPQAGRS